MIAVGERIRECEQATAGWCFRAARSPILRTITRFAEEEIVVPNGPFAGRLLRLDRQPFFRAWFAAIDSGRWHRFVATGPTQSGKTLGMFVIVLMYFLFERGENVVCAVPDMGMVGDKWIEDILPIIEASQYRKFLPRKGPGSQGGIFKSVKFTNGATLRFMTGGGSDKSRSAFTTRIVVVTEADGLAVTGQTSDETDKLSQIIARTRAFKGKAGPPTLVFLECTVSTEKGRIWREYKASTGSIMHLPCPHCGAHVCPEREHFRGWEQAEDEIEAGESGRFHCPDCGQPWTPDQRSAANLAGVLGHAGQVIGSDGAALGEEPRTDTFGLRWSAVHNNLTSEEAIGIESWARERAEDEDNAEREIRQFTWCIPYEPPVWGMAPLTAAAIRARSRRYNRGMMPADTHCLTVGLDPGMRFASWIATAWLVDGTGHVIDYGAIDVPSDDFGLDVALTKALRDFRDMVLSPETTGWADTEGRGRVPDQIWIDARYKTDVVCAFCREPATGQRFRPTMGFGASVHAPGSGFYRAPKRRGKEVKLIGEGYDLRLDTARRLMMVHVDADQWKTAVRHRLATDPDQPGAMMLYQSTDRNEHIKLSKHLTAEEPTQKFVPGKGTVTTWTQTKRQNHWFDAIYLATAAAHLCGVRLIAEPKRKPVVLPARKPLTMPDGRAYMATER